MSWPEVPAAVRAGIEELLGARVVDAASQSGGFSPGVAARVMLADGSRAFVKAVTGERNSESPDIHRREARVAAQLPATAPTPRFRAVYDDGMWVALVFDDIDGALPQLPWEPDELTRVLLAVYEMSDALTPSPISIDAAPEWMTRLFGRWSEFAADDRLRAQLSAAWRGRVDELVALEARWPEAVAGDTLLHLDTRADNILLTRDRVYIVDWPWAAVGAAWVDLGELLPSVAMQGGPDPEVLWQAHPLARGVDGEQLDAFLAALAGFLTFSSLQPSPPGLPTIRPFQAGVAAHTRAWLAQRRGWR